MALGHLGFIDLPAHATAGGFDHAAVHEPTGRIYVAHTANDAVDVIAPPMRTTRDGGDRQVAAAARAAGPPQGSRSPGGA